MNNPQLGFVVNLPAGGTLHLQTQDEVDFVEQTRDAYITDYRLTKINDLALIGAILSQHLTIFRAQQRLTGMEPEFDQARVPTGRYKQIQGFGQKEVTGAQTTITKAATEVREMEKALGIDKKTREAAGEYAVGSYLSTMKKAAHEMGVHITKRTKAYEEFCMELRWKIRVLNNADAEDRAYHDLTEDSILKWAQEELAKLEQLDQQFAKQKGRLFVGKL